MTTPAHYPYSTTYLRDYMRRISRGIILFAAIAVSTAITLAGIFGVWRVVTNAFN